MSKKIIIITIMSLFSLLACRGEDASLATLDEFAGISGGSYNVCSGGFGHYVSAITINSSSSSIIKTAVEQALTSVPTNIQKLFAGAGGKIVVDTDQAQKVCPAILNKQEFKAYIYGGANSAINTCWSFANNAPTIFMEADVDKIRHSLLRTFSYIYSQIIYPAAVKSASVNTSVDQKNLTALKDAFLTDVGKLNPTRASALSSMAPTLLEQYVFAEAFDSYYCNASTKNSFKSNFTNTWNVFTNMIK